MLRDDVSLVDAQAVCLGELQPAVDPATRCGMSKPLCEQSDEELVAKFRSGEQEIRSSISRAIAGAFLCADVVAAFRQRPEPPSFLQIAGLLGVKERTAEHYHTIHGRYSDPSKRPTDVPIRDLNEAYREVQKLMPGAPKEEIGQAAVEMARKTRSLRPTKKPRGRAALKKSAPPAHTTRAEQTPSALPSVVEAIALPAASVVDAPARPAPSTEERATVTAPKPPADFTCEPWHIEQAISRAFASTRTAREVIDLLVAVGEGIQFGLEGLPIPLSLDERKAVTEELREISTLLTRTRVASGVVA